MNQTTLPEFPPVTLEHRTPTLWQRMQQPHPVPLRITCDLVERLWPLNLIDSSCWFTNLVATRIADTGKHVDDLTVRELRDIINECRVGIKKAHKRGLT